VRFETKKNWNVGQMVKAQKDSELSPKCESAKREDFEGKNVGSKIKFGSSR
jgi:hypothetical protein